MYMSFFSIYLLLILFIVNIVNSQNIQVSNEKEFENALNSSSSKIIITSTITLEKNYMLKSKNGLIISGYKPDIMLIFKNETHGLQLKKINNVEISNLIFIGNLEIYNCTKTSILNIKFDGLLRSELLENNNFEIDNITYNNSQYQKSENGIEFNGGNIIINNSKLYGSRSISKYIMFTYTPNNEIDENVDIISKVKITNSTFSGEYSSGLIKSSYSYIEIENSNFINGNVDDYGTLNIKNSRAIVNNCIFKNNYSNQCGGTFSLIEDRFQGMNLSFDNSTSYDEGGIFYIKNIIESRSYSASLTNITANNIIKNENINSSIGLGLNYYSKVSINNLDGNMFGCSLRDSCTLFSINGDTNLNI
eukprot:jgi/Orpsp1_1/1186508/evm.model.d7180000051097.1